jgi:hypothetical protein
MHIKEHWKCTICWQTFSTEKDYKKHVMDSDVHHSANFTWTDDPSQPPYIAYNYDPSKAMDPITAGGMERTEVSNGFIKHHPIDRCQGESCCIHNPSEHHMVNWPLFWRDDRALMERICPHGDNHPDPDDIAFKARSYGKTVAKQAAIHDCDGCCKSKNNTP